MSSSHESDKKIALIRDDATGPSNSPGSSHLDPKHVSNDTSTESDIKVNTNSDENDGLVEEVRPDVAQDTMAEDIAEKGAISHIMVMSKSCEASLQQNTAEKDPSGSTPVEVLPKQSVPQTPTNQESSSKHPTTIHKQEVASPEPPPPPPKDDKFMPAARKSEIDPEKEAMKSEDTDYNMGGGTDGQGESGEVFDDEQSEIASIMEQFEDDQGALGEAEIMSPRLEIGQSFFGSPVGHPPRKSSLEPTRTGSPDSAMGSLTLNSPPPRTSSLGPSSPVPSLRKQSAPHEEPGSPLAPQTSKSLPPPPQPDPESDLPFDFHRFLEQLRHKSADPVAKYLRSFLLEFGKKPWMVHEQVKIISDFLEFITKKMAQSEVWRTVSDAEFDNAREGMEKLVMNRLYTHTFSPAIPSPAPARASSKGKRRTGAQPDTTQPGRRGQHQEDVERDEVLAQKVRIYGWVKEEHLDIVPIGEKGRRFMDLAQRELEKIKSYRAPRDKVICILNCCKVIFGFLRNSQHDQSADSFIPLLIYVVLHAKPDHLVSNVQYILRFRNQDKLGGEAGYYISSLMGAVQFIENLDRTSLTISDEDFEKNVEAAVSAIAERHSEEEARLSRPPPSPNLQPSEKSSLAQPEITPRNSLEAEQSTPRRANSQRRLQRDSGKSESEGEENPAMAVLRTIQRPLSSIGRIFSDDGGAAPNAPSTPQSGSTSRLPPASRLGDALEVPGRRSGEEKRIQKLSAEDAAARQASAETEQARKIRAREEATVVETLSGMFPGLDKDIILDVVRANEGRIGSAVDACLSLSAT
ncbi:hypothetical protein FKW77_005873 [Venturia effusa]|uniref:VPS9 domain-containing protein n=1 Tax=Venturia effusa TaxID=50376 RepID=A0A517LCD6_9PEZI|nr:hypothetical protein FKW77_005873 [Venturia effusa]